MWNNSFRGTEAETVQANPKSHLPKLKTIQHKKGQALALDLPNPFTLFYKLSHPKKKLLSFILKKATELARHAPFSPG